MLCPYCEYGMVLRAKIKDLDKKIYICEECDTVGEFHESDWFIGFGRD